MFAIGVLLFRLLLAEYPFKRAKEAEYEVVSDYDRFWRQFKRAAALSEETKTFVWRLLARDPQLRIEAYKQRISFLSALYGADRQTVHDAIETELLGLVELRQAKHQKKEIVEKRPEECRYILQEEQTLYDPFRERAEFVPPRDSLFFWDQIQSGLFL